jgi:hypothetical protein
VEKQGFGLFLASKFIFDSKHPKHLDKPNNSSKNKNQLEPKNILVVKFALQARIRKKKHLAKTTLVK